MAVFNLNTATLDELLANVRIMGRERAERIINYRDEHGGFGTWEDLKHVPGISEKMVQDIRSTGAMLDSER